MWKLLEGLGFEREAHYKQNVYFWKVDNNKPIWKDTFVFYNKRYILEKGTGINSLRGIKEGESWNT